MRQWTIEKWAAVIALVLAVPGAIEATLHLLKGSSTAAWWILLVIALCVPYVVVFRPLLSRRCRSVLANPAALLLTRKNTAHLVGREPHIERLERLCREYALVFLEGDSGVGKSALLQAGLIPRLKDAPDILPIYVENLVGPDWQQGPRQNLSAALRESLTSMDGSPDQRNPSILTLAESASPRTIFSVIRAIPTELGRRPLLVLDQLDDYQSRFRQRLLDPDRRTWLAPEQLCAQNSFWRELRDVLKTGTVHVLMAVRTDTMTDSLQFFDYKKYPLDRLPRGEIGPLLTKLGKDAVSDPDCGWDELAQRLESDIETDKTILPQQLKVVLAGLKHLPGRLLTVDGYERSQCAPGIEVLFIEEAIERAARLRMRDFDRNTAELRVRRLLMALVDQQNEKKTVQRPENELCNLIDSNNPLTGRGVLEELEGEEVVRSRIVFESADSDAVGTYWLLDHDYLTGPVREADRRVDQWQRTLRDGARALAMARRSLRAGWRALLPPRTQLILFRHRLSGQFRYRPYRSYAMKSLLRFIPGLASFSLAVLVGSALVYWPRAVSDSAETALRNLKAVFNQPHDGYVDVPRDVAIEDAVPHLKQLRNLRGLYIHGTLASLDLIGELTSVTELRLADAQNIKSLSPLANFKNLKSLDLAGASEIDSLEPLRALTKLETLHITHAIKIISLAPLENLTKLQKLDIRDAQQVADLSPLGKLKQLHTLSLPGARGVVSLEPVSGLSALTALDLAHATAIRSVWPLQQLSKLDYLDLTGTTEIDLAALSSVTTLRSLELATATVRNAEALGHLAHLHYLGLREAKNIGDMKEILRQLGSLKELEVLDLHGVNGIEDLTALQELKGLWSLDLGCTGVEAGGAVTQLKDLAKTLRYLEIRPCLPKDLQRTLENTAVWKLITRRAAPDLSGAWGCEGYCPSGGIGETASIWQLGDTLQFINEGGDRSAGRFERDRFSAIALDWENGLEGKICFGGAEIRWSNSTIWKKQGLPR
jgi:hypothetical protein